jgi:hypothetical protein
MNEQRSGEPQQPSTDQSGEDHSRDQEQPIHERSDKLNDYNDPVDEASDDSFPASDPPSFTDSTATSTPDRHPPDSPPKR